MADDRFTTVESRQEHGDAFTELLRALFKTRTSSEWLTLLREEHNLPIELVARFSDLQDDPHVSLNNIVSEPQDDIGMNLVINDTVNVDGLGKLAPKRAPEMGEHTEKVLRELGYTDKELAQFVTDGII